MKINPKTSGASEVACRIVNETFLALDGFAKMRAEMADSTYTAEQFAAEIARIIDRELKSNRMVTHSPEVTRVGVLGMQVCIPADWTDDQVVSFAEERYPCGTSHGWHIRRECPERVDCNGRSGFVHVMLDA